MSFTETLNSYSLFILFPALLLVMATMLPVRRWRLRIPLYTAVLVIGVVGYAFLRP